MDDSPKDTNTGLVGDPSLPPIPALPMGATPEPDFQESVCLKGKEGKCSYLWVIQTNFSNGNTAGTFEPGEEPRAIARSCLRGGGEEMDLNGVVVYACSEHSDTDIARVQESFVFEDAPTSPTPPPTTTDNRMPLFKLTKKETATNE